MEATWRAPDSAETLRTARYHPRMDHTAGPIREIGVVLPGAVGAGWLARRALVAAVAVSIAISTVVARLVGRVGAEPDVSLAPAP